MSLAEQVTYRAGGPGRIASPVRWIESHPVTRVRVDSLVLDGSPRLSGPDQAHVRMLAETKNALPPITVHRPTLRVIDGVHRVHAARLNGRGEVPARLLDCDRATAFVLAVEANVAHGLPLTRADRTAAAARIIEAFPQWSDRAVAAAVGISDKTVSRLRTRSGAGRVVQTGTRLGQDGRVRPLDSGRRRRRAAALLREAPDAGLREVARATGLSPATVRDVRRRIDRGEDPVPGRYREVRPALLTPVGPDRRRPAAAPADGEREAVVVDRNRLLAKLNEDPSLRLSESGRRALRWLRHYSVTGQDIETLAHGLPCHWAPEVADLARSCAAAWSELAELLQERAQ
ncbi:ParB/RepB/Spo0J family partition protein [Streptomyces laculatispora]|uniref:ParB/RepB/Spo0J family partition protein n=1 Tax=Streptomyces laculatispora TaxID=887464 RepID=UPI001A942E49|nr:ParB/RepB/Spo0J family partition protein [Streptomyces laculatispora]MBO0916168.1 ParB-like nuclease domain-containing protein [Streptomyces laculatispora]